MSTQPLRDRPDASPKRLPRRTGVDESEARLLERLLRGDEEACRGLIRRYHDAMVQVARGYVGTRAVAEEVAQEAWIAVFRGLPGFQRRSSLRSWLFSILIHRARTAAVRERRSEAISQLVAERERGAADALDAFFHGADHPGAGSWALPPRPWRRDPEERALDAETRAWLNEAIEGLPDMQRLVVVLRDIEGWDTREIAEALGRTSNWVRVTLHRARFKLRLAIEAKWGIEE